MGETNASILPPVKAAILLVLSLQHPIIIYKIFLFSFAPLQLSCQKKNYSYVEKHWRVHTLTQIPRPVMTMVNTKENSIGIYHRLLD